MKGLRAPRKDKGTVRSGKLSDFGLWLQIMLVRMPIIDDAGFECPCGASTRLHTELSACRRVSMKLGRLEVPGLKWFCITDRVR